MIELHPLRSSLHEHGIVPVDMDVYWLALRSCPVNFNS
jgi:hypothetical protein